MKPHPNMTDPFRRSNCASIAVFLCIGLSMSLLGCGSEEATTSPAVPTGTYDLTVDRGRDTVRATVQLVEGVDGALWGHARIRSDEPFDSGIGRTGATSDSVSFEVSLEPFRDNRLTLPTTPVPDTGPLTGSARINDTLYTATMQRRSATVGDSLRALVGYAPLDLPGIDTATWAAPTSDRFLYFIDRNAKTIQTARKSADGWVVEPVAYDTSRYRLSAVGVSLNGSQLVVHGRYRSGNGPPGDSTVGNSDLFLLHLRDSLRVDRVEHLPRPVNSEAYDIFPSFAPNGDLLFSSARGNSQGAQQDLYRATPTGDGYRVERFADVVNTAAPESSPYLDPQNRYLLFYRRPNTDKIYVSRRTADGWSAADRLGPPVNSFYAYEYAARVSPSGEYLFVNSGRRNSTGIYRIPIADIPELVPLHD